MMHVSEMWSGNPIGSCLESTPEMRCRIDHIRATSRWSRLIVEIEMPRYSGRHLVSRLRWCSVGRRGGGGRFGLIVRLTALALGTLASRSRFVSLTLRWTSRIVMVTITLEVDPDTSTADFVAGLVS